MKKVLCKSLFVALLVISVWSGAVLAVSASKAVSANKATEYQTNENGVTYGYYNPMISPEKQANPQMIGAIGIDGVEGYVYESDLNGDQPKTPEEAVKYMENLESQISRAKENGQEYLRYIPLYAEDGITVIGEFGISYPEG